MPESSSQDAGPGGHTVVVMTRSGCPTCERAEQDVERICGELGVRWSTADVDTDPEWRAEYGDRVPVILVDGDEHGYWSVDEQRLRAALEA
ncbi:glutaredoxin family protein [Saccharomonospora sp.]|uniref:glutaredoxin family protein n=1 Tax=Saccharomonospora sp. TaxID=33913 RepID=UPI00262592EA|nr:glutaredoxin family protein [Saccharomonospora sp.]